MRLGSSLGLVALSVSRCASAQVPAEGPGKPWIRPAGQTVAEFTQVQGIPGGGSLGEARLVESVLMVDAAALGNHLRFRGSLDAEGWTMPHGELSPGAWGEGYMDRRHPHTYFHELMLTGYDLLGRRDGAAELSVSLGKGFVPYGTDDPMSRPVLRYPVNHHLAQILERAMVAAGVRRGPAELEGAVFNGDEPEYPSQWPRLSRFGDSWALRLTLRPVGGLEWQLSRAKVASPEHRGGAGTTNWMWSSSLRVARMVRGVPVYGLVEWARASEAGGLFVFRSALGEVAGSPGRHRVYYRFERTERPEEQRTADPFRSVRPHLDDQLLGITRWSIHTLGYGYAFMYGGPVEVRPFVEVSRAHPHATVGVFDPASFYGRDIIWSESVGVRLSWRMAEHRMGRYRDPIAHPEMPGGHEH